MLIIIVIFDKHKIKFLLKYMQLNYYNQYETILMVPYLIFEDLSHRHLNIHFWLLKIKNNN